MSATLAERPSVTPPRVQHLLDRGWRLTEGPDGAWMFTHPVQAGFITLPADVTAPTSEGRRRRRSSDVPI